MHVRRPRILVMDDSPLALDVIRRGLQARGLEVHCARRLADLDRQQERPDLVLMDVDMPEVLGDDVADWLRSTRGLEVPIYLFSNLGEDELARRTAEAGAEGYFPKSMGIEEVVERVSSILSGGERAAVDLKTEFLPALLAAARRRYRRLAHLIEGGMNEVEALGSELHTLLGEAALLGCKDLVAAVISAQAVLAGGGGVGTGILAPLARAIDQLAEELVGRVGGSPRRELAIRPPSGRRLLILDDSDFYRATLLVLLEERGHEVVEACSLSEARYKIHDGHYHLALLDVHLEDGAGPTLIPELRDVQPGIRLVVVTGDEPDAVGASPADLVLAKNMPTDELLDRIENLLTQ